MILILCYGYKHTQEGNQILQKAVISSEYLQESQRIQGLQTSLGVYSAQRRNAWTYVSLRIHIYEAKNC